MDCGTTPSEPKAHNPSLGYESIDLTRLRPVGFLEKSHERSQQRIRCVEDGHGWQDVLVCPLCKSPNRAIEFQVMNVDLLRCQDCTLAYGAKVPVEPNDIYSDKAYVPSTRNEYESTVAYRKQRFGRERLALIESIIGPLTEKKILDVGCGLGWFLEVAQDEGMVISGIELGSDLAKSASQTLGITVHQSTLENRPEEAAFDVIVMFDLIEHVPDPLSLVLEAKKRLMPGGILLAFTPNFDSLSISVQGGHSNLLMPTDHLQLFNRESVDHLASLVAMNLEYFQVAGIDMGDLKSHFEWLGDMDQAAACETLQDSLQPTLDRQGLGNHLRFVLRK